MPTSLRSILAVSALGLLTFSAFGQKFQPKDIRFEGASSYTQQELLSATGLNVGMTLTTEVMNGAAQKIIDTGLFSNVSYRFANTDLIFTLSPAANLYPVRFPNLPAEWLNDLTPRLQHSLPVFHGQSAAEGTIFEGVRTELARLLAEKGVAATVVAGPHSNPQNRTLSIDFEITSPTVVVGDLALQGQVPVVDAKLTEALGHLKDAPFDADASAKQIDAYIGQCFRDEAYLDTSVQATAMPAQIKPGSIRIPFRIQIDPGVRYKIASIHLDPTVVVSQADFDHQSGIHTGDLADQTHTLQNWDYIERQYHNHGYLKARIKPQPVLDRTSGTVAYTVTAEPGAAYTMGQLSVTNADATVRSLLLGAWRITPNTPFNEGQITAMTATHGVNPTLERLFTIAELHYKLQLNDDTRTVDVTLWVTKRK